MDYKQFNDYELIDRVRENDDDSNSILFLKYQPILHNIAHEYYKKYSSYGYEYEDFYQEALISFYRALSHFDEGKDVLFYTFVTVCVRRNLSSFCRNISIRNNALPSYHFVDLDQCSIEDVESDISMHFNKEEVHSIIKSILLDFPIEVSSIIELHVNGFSYREIGKLLDIPASSVEFRSRKARNILLTRIHNYYCK